MSDHWLDFWREHATATRDRDDQTQVLRTVGGVPIDSERFDGLLQDITEKLALEGDERILDLCCGNGLIARHLAPRCGSILGVDLCPEFVAKVNALGIANLAAEVGDITALEIDDESFDRVLVYAALQYFERGAALRLLRSIRRWLRPGGSLLLGDVPDAARIWAFFDTDERRRAHFGGLLAGEPVIGTWFDAEWLCKGAAALGYETAEVLAQPASSPNGHYRFDMLLRRGDAGRA